MQKSICVGMWMGPLGSIALEMCVLDQVLLGDVSLANRFSLRRFKFSGSIITEQLD